MCCCVSLQTRPSGSRRSYRKAPARLEHPAVKTSSDMRHVGVKPSPVFAAPRGLAAPPALGRPHLVCPVPRSGREQQITGRYARLRCVASRGHLGNLDAATHLCETHTHARVLPHCQALAGLLTASRAIAILPYRAA